MGVLLSVHRHGYVHWLLTFPSRPTAPEFNMVWNDSAGFCQITIVTFR
jgi:hypothetical protein